MLRISSIKIGHLNGGCITDERPEIRFSLESDIQGESLDYATISSGDWTLTTKDQLNNIYGGAMLPFSTVKVHISAVGKSGEVAEADASFSTGRLNTPWSAKWITDLSYSFSRRKSPLPMVFTRDFSVKKTLNKAWINSTALGIYEIFLNGNRVGEDYFAPGFTSYDHNIQYQTYDLTRLIKENNKIKVAVAGGWAAGSFTMSRKSHISCDRQAFLGEIYLEYEDSSREIITTDESWCVTEDSPYSLADWYDGEDYDATFEEETAKYRPASITQLKNNSKISAQYGQPVQEARNISPTLLCKTEGGEIIYDFGENFAGVIHLRIKNAKKGQKITVRHSEVLVNGELFIKALRTARATVNYICKEGCQEYSPRFTYMGFRYVGVGGIDPDDLEISAFVLHSKLESVGDFICSDERLNKLNENIRRGGLSNFVDIPTDCPQRDERMGWTGDAAVFASTACYNFDMSRFFDKWLRDMSAEQGRGGGIPTVIPRQGYGNFTFATSCWGDSCVLVPFAEYMARGDLSLLRRQYATMKKFVLAEKWWASLASIGDAKYIWGRLPFHYGDWCAPDGGFYLWKSRAKWIATAYFANSCSHLVKIATLLDENEDAKYFEKLREKISYSYIKFLTDGKGKLKKEFQSAYVLPLHFGMTTGEEANIMTDNLNRLLLENDYKIGTGFPGTPYLLFALSDNGHIETAYKTLMQEECPGWLYAVKVGATTVWERWDALKPDGTVNMGENANRGGMVSFNHYANGAVGDWLYRRVAGIEATSGGYKTFKIAPMPGGGLTFARGAVKSPYGDIISDWKIENDIFHITVKVPVSADCTLLLPNGDIHNLSSGFYEFTCNLNKKA